MINNDFIIRPPRKEIILLSSSTSPTESKNGIISILRSQRVESPLYFLINTVSPLMQGRTFNIFKEIANVFLNKFKRLSARFTARSDTS